MQPTDTVLLVEDSNDDAFFLERAWKVVEIVNPLQRVKDGQQAIDYFSGDGEYSDRQKFPTPNLVLLDLKLPFKNGHEVLKAIRDSPAGRHCIVIMLTGSRDLKDLQKAYELGANAYLVKPPSAAKLIELLRAFKAFWLGFNERA